MSAASRSGCSAAAKWPPHWWTVHRRIAYSRSYHDTSVSGWCMLAYASGDHYGLEMNKAALQLAATLLDLVAESSGGHGYSKQGEPVARCGVNRQTIS